MELMLESPDGLRSAYVYTGGKAFDPTRPAIVFVHGAMHDHSVWTLLARWFAHHGHAAMAPDLPGHGRTPGAPLQTVEALAAWVIALLDAAGVRRATLVGHSMGSLISLEVAASAPDRVERLVMLATAYPMTVSPALLDTARTAPLRAIDMVNAYSHSTLAGKPAYPGPGSWLHGANRALMRRVLAGQRHENLFVRDFEVCNGYEGGLAAAAKVRCPVHLILGSRDQMTAPKQAADLGAALEADVVMLPAGHSLMSEAPDAVLDALRHALG